MSINVEDACRNPRRHRGEGGKLGKIDERRKANAVKNKNTSGVERPISRHRACDRHVAAQRHSNVTYSGLFLHVFFASSKSGQRDVTTT